MQKYLLSERIGLTYSYEEKENLLKDLSKKIYIQGADKHCNQFLQLKLKNGANMQNVKSILKKHFGIEYKLKYDWESMQNIRFCKQDDIIELCRIYLENNADLDYYNKYDPLQERNTISKRVYQYGAVRYDLLIV